MLEEKSEYFINGVRFLKTQLYYTTADYARDYFYGADQKIDCPKEQNPNSTLEPGTYRIVDGAIHKIA